MLSKSIVAVGAVLAAILSLSPARSAQRWPSTVRDEIGVNIHFTDPQPGEMDMLSAAGFGWARMDLSWEATEKSKGVYDFSHYDTLMSALKRHHMHALFIFDYGNDIYGASGKPPYDDVGRAAFARWAVAAVTHFKGQGAMWELWNEPNGDWFWPSHSAVDYAKLAMTVEPAIHNADPGETLIGPATSGFDWDFVETCFKAGTLNYWDAVSVHPYRQNEPESATPDYARLRALIARYAPQGKSIPIVSGEWGYSVTWGGYSEARQGDYLAREFLSNIQNGVPVSIWYDWHNDGTNPSDAESNFGTVSNPYHAGQSPVYDPKPAYLACATLTRLLGDYHFDGIDAGNLDPPDHVLRFVHRRERRWAAWTSDATPHTVHISAPLGDYHIWSEDGAVSTTITADASGLEVTVSGSPVYIVSARH